MQMSLRIAKAHTGDYSHFIYVGALAKHTTDDQAAILRNAISRLLALDYVYVATTVIVIYEWIINIDREVAVVWSQKRSLPFGIFVVIRVSIAILVIIPWINASPSL
ncbi:hypothetical protein PsYK624_003840 [Phanerochaete sordida]|uniref:DUF6533 domain-containing protein n=1 Tax=Phanerochaete sordida TaxID=48140 RepID=A0A9P3FXC8_9APHY|nr:hypothetical protein PsYK624_003840 [Phanerochaete sordida]